MAENGRPRVLRQTETREDLGYRSPRHAAAKPRPRRIPDLDHGGQVERLPRAVDVPAVKIQPKRRRQPRRQAMQDLSVSGEEEQTPDAGLGGRREYPADERRQDRTGDVGADAS